MTPKEENTQYQNLFSITAYFYSVTDKKIACDIARRLDGMSKSRAKAILDTVSAILVYTTEINLSANQVFQKFEQTIDQLCSGKE